MWELLSHYNEEANEARSWCGECEHRRILLSFSYTTRGRAFVCRARVWAPSCFCGSLVIGKTRSCEPYLMGFPRLMSLTTGGARSQGRRAHGIKLERHADDWRPDARDGDLARTHGSERDSQLSCHRPHWGLYGTQGRGQSRTAQARGLCRVIVRWR